MNELDTYTDNNFNQNNPDNRESEPPEAQNSENYTLVIENRLMECKSRSEFMHKKLKDISEIMDMHSAFGGNIEDELRMIKKIVEPYSKYR